MHGALAYRRDRYHSSSISEERDTKNSNLMDSSLITWLVDLIRNRPQYVLKPSRFTYAADLAAECEEADLFRLMHWRTRYADHLPGRQEEEKRLLEWAHAGPGTLSVGIISAPGGAGKTKLAAHVAERLEANNWNAGFLLPDAKGTLPEKPPGFLAHNLFIVIDYPEERLATVENALQRLAGWTSPTRSVRVLLLTREKNPRRLMDMLHANDLRTDFVSNLPSLKALPGEAAMELARQVLDVLNGRAQFRHCQEAERKDFEDWFRDWLERDAQHGLPLMVIAATLHWLLGEGSGPDPDISDSELLQAMAEREMNRARAVSRQASLGNDCLPRLLALATLAGGLNEDRLRAILDMNRNLSPCAATAEIDAVIDSSWWDSPETGAPPRLLPLQPDRAAAAFIHEALLKDGTFRKDSLSHWLAVALEDQEEAFCERLPRIMWDLRQAREGCEVRLRNTLTTMIENAPERASAFQPLTTISNHRTAPLAIVICRILLEDTEEEKFRASLLNRLADRLSETGESGEALRPAQEAVDIYRKLAKENPDAYLPGLAMSFNNLARRLSETGERRAALQPAREATDIYRTLAKKNPTTFIPELAISLNNLGVFFSETGNYGAALQSTREAEKIYRGLAEKKPNTFLSRLAMSLHNLAIRLSKAGDRRAALKPAREAVEIYRKLAEENPAAFLPELAKSLNNLASRLSEAGNHHAALQSTHEAVDICRKLVEENPAAFLPELAMGLNNLGAFLSMIGAYGAALQPVREAVAIRRKLSEENPAFFLPDLAKSLGNLAIIFSELGNRRTALQLAREAVDIYRKLVKENPTVFLPELIKSLNNLAAHLSKTEDYEAALTHCTEGLHLIAEPLSILPEAHVQLAAVLVRMYLDACKQVGREPDEGLLAPLAPCLVQFLRSSGKD